MRTKPHDALRRTGGFTLTEMLVTTLIVTLAATLLSTGIPVAVDTYQKTVNSSNAQLALSTTITVLRSELGASPEVRVVGNDIYYISGEGSWACIRNAKDHSGGSSGKKFRGLEKQYYAGIPTGSGLTDVSGLTELLDAANKPMVYPLLSDAAIAGNHLTGDLTVSFETVAPIYDSESLPTKVQALALTNLQVVDRAGNALAKVGDSSTEPFLIPTRFTQPA